MADANPSPVLVVSNAGRLLYANPASWLILQQWNVAVGEVLPEPWAGAARSAWQEVRTEVRTLTAGHVSIRLLFVPDPEKEQLYVFGVDATRDRQMEKELLIKAHVQAQAHEAIIVTDEEFRTLDINPAYTRLTGYGEADALGERPSFLQAVRADGELYEEIMESLEANGSWHGELWDRTRSGERFAARVSITAVRFESQSVTHYVALISDITAQKAAEEQLYRMAHYDALTGLPNRYLFADYVHNAISHARRTGKQFALMLLDLDGFKSINDTLGHRGGDKLLQAVGRRMAATLRRSDLIARFGGDEFAILVRDLDVSQDAVLIARKLLAAVSETSEIEGHEVFVTASIGVAMYPRDQTAIEPLLRQADSAMYKIKCRGKNDVRFFAEDLEGEVEGGVPLQAALRSALDDGRIGVHYQPQVDIVSGALTGVEALARWTDGGRGAVSPDEFIPVAEQYGLIARVGEQVLRTACLQGLRWERELGVAMRVSVNVSVRQLLQKGFASRVERTLSELGYPPDRLGLELTETIFIEDASEILPVLQSLAASGMLLAIDDFGTQYASLLYIKSFPVHRLKIDKLFVKDVPWDHNAAQIVTAIIALGDRLGYEVIAEGVESADQLSFLRGAGCRQVQGFLCSPPVEAQGLEEMLRTGWGGIGAAGDRPGRGYRPSRFFSRHEKT